jgi:hypothetical protein
MTEEAKPYVTAGIVKLFAREVRDGDRKGTRVFERGARPEPSRAIVCSFGSAPVVL